MVHPGLVFAETKEDLHKSVRTSMYANYCAFHKKTSDILDLVLCRYDELTSCPSTFAFTTNTGQDRGSYLVWNILFWFLIGGGVTWSLA